MISPLLGPSRKPLNALRGLRRKMAHFIPSAGVHTKGSYNSTRINAPQRPDCVAGVVGFELRNVGANYPFESSHRFPGISRILASETIRV